MMKESLVRFFIFMIPSIGVFAQHRLSLEDSWNYALENNVNIKKARIDQQVSGYKVKQSIGVGLPQVDLQGGYNHFLKIPVQLLPSKMLDPDAPVGETVPVKMGQKQNMTGGVTLRQLFFSASYLVGLKSARAYRESSDLAEEKTEISVKEAVWLSYVTVLITEKNIETLEENVKIAEKTLGDTRKVYEKGLVEEQRVQQLEYSFKNISASLENLRRSRLKLLMAFKYIIGYPLDEEVVLNSEINQILEKSEEYSLDEGNVDVFSHIDFRLTDNALKLSKLELQYQRSQSLPSLSGTLSSTYNAYSPDFSFLDKTQSWFNTSVVGLQLNIPIFSGLQRHFQSQEAKLGVRKAELDKRDMENHLKNEIYSAKVDYTNSYNAYKVAQELVELTGDIYRKEQIKFQEGIASSFDLQNSETQFYDSQSRYYQSSMDLVQSRIKLDRALGKL